MENLYKVASKVKGAKFIKGRDLSTTTAEDAIRKEFNDKESDRLVNLEAYENPSSVSLDMPKQKSEVPILTTKTTPGKDITTTHSSKPIKIAIYI